MAASEAVCPHQTQGAPTDPSSQPSDQKEEQGNYVGQFVLKEMTKRSHNTLSDLNYTQAAGETRKIFPSS